MDGLGGSEWRFHRFIINHYVIFFVGAGCSFGVTAILVRALEEPSAARVQALLREVLIDGPQRVWARLMTR